VKEFLRKVAIYISVVYLLGTSIIYVLMKIDPGRFVGYYSDFVMWNFQKKVIAHPEKVNRNIIIGDSRAQADLDPTIIGHSFTNLAIAGASPYEGYLTIKRILKNKKIDTILVTYGAYHYTTSDNFHDMSLPYNFPTADDLSELEKVESTLGITIDNDTPSAIRRLNRRFIYYHIPVNNFRATFIRNMFQKELDPYSASMEKYSGHVLFGKKDSSNELSQEVVALKSWQRFPKNPVVAVYLDSIVNLAMRNHAKVFIVPPPLNYVTFKALEKTKYFTQYNSFLSSYKNRGALTELVYPCPYLPDSLFGDRSHLNVRGSRYFSLLLKHMIEKSSAAK
jgi:hypothetical protein